MLKQVKHRFCKQIPVGILAVGFSFVFLFTANSVQAESVQLTQLTIEKNVQKDLQKIEKFKLSVPKPFTFSARDSQTLDILRENQLSQVYEILPTPSFQSLRTTRVNLYRYDRPRTSPFRLDLRLSSKISLEARTRFLDTLVIVDPLNGRVSLGIIHEFGKKTSISAFLDPIREEIYSIISHKISSQTELALIYYQDGYEGRKDLFGSIKFYF